MPDPAPLGAARAFARRVRRSHAEIRDVLLFGSFARGDAGARSDVDVLVVWDGDHAQGLARMADAAFEHLLDSGVYVSVKVLTPQELDDGRRGHDPFVEGVLADARSLA